MKAFFKRYLPYIVLIVCFLWTIVPAAPRQEASQPAQPAAAQPSSGRRYPGEALFLTPYLPDEPQHNAALGLWQTHAGLDLACSGTFSSPVSGEIGSVYDDRLWGACVEIRTQDGLLRCRSLRDICVTQGQSIRAGDPIGAPAAAPFEADLGAHVHLEYFVHGRSADPSSLFR